jgi:hypothetical protein
MSLEVASWKDSQLFDGDNLQDRLELLVNRGEMEVVTTTSGEILYILQSIDE